MSEPGTGPRWESLVRKVCGWRARARCDGCDLLHRAQMDAFYKGGANILSAMGLSDLFHQTRKRLYGEPWPLFDATSDELEGLVPDTASGDGAQ